MRCSLVLVSKLATVVARGPVRAYQIGKHPEHGPARAFLDVVNQGARQNVSAAIARLYVFEKAGSEQDA